MKRRFDPRRAGISLLHLVLLLSSLTLTASLAIPAWFGRGEITLDHATELLARDLRDAQDRAAFQHRSLRVEFDPAGDGYTVVDADGKAIEAPVGNGTFHRRYSKDAVFRGVRIEQIEVGPESAVSFGPRGLALNGGRLVLAFEGELRHLVIEPTSGVVRIDGQVLDPR
jgi:Type II transport protein GspH